MLALGAGRLPVLNPAAFHFSSDAVLITTSRHAVKLRLIRRDPRAAFLVAPDGHRGGNGVLLQGLLEAYDPRSLRSQLQAVSQGPSLALNLAGYALKNASFIGGYLLDLARIPSEWWPQNRVLLRLRADHLRLVPGLKPPPAQQARIPGPPADVSASVARHRTGHLCWLGAGRPVVVSVAWALDGGDAVAWLPSSVPRPPGEDVPAALLVEYHHSFRATRMRGVCMRGHLVSDPAARAALAFRYRGELPAGGTTVRIQVAKVTWWRGFHVRTVPAPAAAAELPRRRAGVR